MINKILSMLTYRDQYGNLFLHERCAWLGLLVIAVGVLAVAWVEGHTAVIA